MHYIAAFLRNEIPDHIIVEGDDALAPSSNTIIINMSVLSRLEANREFMFGAQKRMGKGTSLSKLPLVCLACPGYVVNHDVMRSCTYEDLGKAWEFIETISTASYEATRTLIRAVRNGRGLEGYRLHMGMIETRYGNTVRTADEVTREIRSAGSIKFTAVRVDEPLVHSVARVLNLGNSLALKSSLKLGLPVPPPLHHTVHEEQDDTETVYSLDQSSLSQSIL